LKPEASYRPNVFIIVPAYNESKEILSEVLDKLLLIPFRIILIDDGSLQPVVNPQPERIILVRHPVNLGQGASLQTGFIIARDKNADYVITYDADGQHQPSDIYTLLNPLLNNEADITLGSRFLEKSQHNAGLVRRVMLSTARVINNLFTGVSLTDAHNGLRGLNKKALECIQLTENRMAHATELIYKIKKHQLRYLEVPTHIVYSEYSKRKGQRFTDGIKVLFDLVLHKLFE
jgi:glycosyltransferase involved in cell wall biosynthesis